MPKEKETDKFDPYREALVVEINTIWPEELGQFDPPQRGQIEERLHADPASAALCEYIRLHTGFCRQITVTAEDLQRIKDQ